MGITILSCQPLACQLMNNHLEQLDVSPLLSMQGEKKTLYVVLPHDSLLQEGTESLHGLALREWDLSSNEAKG
jgi:hypothetical protein